MSDLLSACCADCTEAQLEAICHVEGPLLVLAGAGSGKTRVITRRVAYLIARGVDPRSVLAITFTNKAAGEMRERIERIGGTKGVWVSTFHSACARLLRGCADRLGYTSEFTIYDTADSVALVRRVIRELKLDPSEWRPAAAAQRISAARSALVSPDEMAAGPLADPHMVRIYQRYVQRLREQNAMDFDDLLLRMVELLRDHADVRERLQRRFRFLLVDEYQDTNRAQYTIAKTLAEEHRNFCATGDPDQSIYSWRGADIGNILDFEKDYPDAHVVRLEQNYRSTKHILKAAAGLISKNRLRKEKELWTENPEGAPLHVRACEDETDEGVYIADAIRGLVADGRSGLNEVAVFYRTNAQSRAIETAMRTSGVPYTVVQGVEFYQRKEIKDLLAYLRLLVNPGDEVSLERIANVPPRGLGTVSLEKVRTLARLAGVPMARALAEPRKAGLRGASAEAALSLAALLEQLRPLAAGSAADALRQVFQRTAYREYLGTLEDPEERVANVEELVNAAALHDAEEPEGGVLGFLERSALVSDVDRLDKGSGRASLMTLHCAKGLEFDVVFIVGVEEGLLPLAREEIVEDLEEERRLCFVGMTRARKELHLSYAASRTRFGRVAYSRPSRFLDEIPAEVIDHLGPAGPAFAPGPAPALRPAARGGGVALHADSPFRTGDVVVHPTFGRGRVLGLSGFGEMRKAMVSFASVGVKQLVLKYAKLTKG